MNFNKDNCMFLGHGTTEYNAIMIIEKGLGLPDYSSPSFDENGIFHTTVRINGDLNKDKQRLDNWPHNNSKHIVLIAIPKDYVILKSKDNSLLPYIREGVYDDFTYFVRPEFIMGYYDATKGKVIVNPKFYNNLSKKEQEECDKQTKELFVSVLNSEEIGGIKRYYDKLDDEEKRKFPLTTKEIDNLDRSDDFVETASIGRRSLNDPYRLPYIKKEKLENVKSTQTSQKKENTPKREREKIFIKYF